MNPPAVSATTATPSWDTLRMFLCVVEEGSLSRASNQLGLSQSTLTRQISALEDTMGMALFERTARGMSLTERGQALLGPVRAMREQSLAVARIGQGLDETLRGVARISASELVAAELLPAMLAEMREAFPEIDVVLISTDDVSNLVEREADIAVRMLRPEQPGLVARKVAELPIGIYAHEDYLARRGEPATLEALRDHDLVAFTHGDILRNSLIRAGLDESRLRFAFTSTSHLVAWNLVRAGLGIGFVSDVIGRSEPRARRIMRDARTPALPVWMTVHQEVKSNRRLRTVFDFLASRFEALGSRADAAP